MVGSEIVMGDGRFTVVMPVPWVQRPSASVEIPTPPPEARVTFVKLQPPTTTMAEV